MSFDYKLKVDVKGKEISCRAFTLREYKDLLKAKLEKTLDQTILDLLKKCTDAHGLNKQESELLLVKLWAASLGEVNQEQTWVCECGKEVQVNINFNHAQIENEVDVLEWTFTNFKVRFKYPELFDDSNIPLMISKSIEFIDVNGESIKLDDLSSSELDDLYTAISGDDIKGIAEMLLKPKVILAVPISCECGKQEVHVIRGLKEFFKLI